MRRPRLAEQLKDFVPDQQVCCGPYRSVDRHQDVALLRAKPHSHAVARQHFDLANMRDEIFWNGNAFEHPHHKPRSCSVVWNSQPRVELFAIKIDAALREVLEVSSEYRIRFSRKTVRAARGPADWSVDPDSEPGRSAPIRIRSHVRPERCACPPSCANLAGRATLHLCPSSPFIAPGDALMNPNHVIENESRGEFGVPAPDQPCLQSLGA